MSRNFLSIIILTIFLASCEKEVIIHPASTPVNRSSSDALKTSSNDIKYVLDPRLFDEWIFNESDDSKYEITFYKYSNELVVKYFTSKKSSKFQEDSYRTIPIGEGLMKIIDKNDGEVDQWEYEFEYDKKGNKILLLKNKFDKNFHRYETKSSKEKFKFLKKIIKK